MLDGEQVENGGEAPEEVTASEDFSYGDALTQETPDPESSGGEENVESSQEIDEQKQELSQFNPDDEVTLELGGKTFTLKAGEAMQYLENAQSISEKEKRLNQDYTQKTQALAEQRKSFESAFGGRLPEQDELQALGKVWNAYFNDPQAQRAINAILSGQSVGQVQGQRGESQDPVVSGLKSEIQSLKDQLSQFVSGTEREKHEAKVHEGERIFNNWLKAKTDEGVKVDDATQDKVLQWAGFIRQSNPNLDATQALNEAYRHLNIDQMDKQATQKVFAKTSEAKKGSIKINPKTPSRSESDKSYSEILLES